MKTMKSAITLLFFISTLSVADITTSSKLTSVEFNGPAALSLFTSIAENRNVKKLSEGLSIPIIIQLEVANVYEGEKYMQTITCKDFSNPLAGEAWHPDMYRCAIEDNN